MSLKYSLFSDVNFSNFLSLEIVFNMFCDGIAFAQQERKERVSSKNNNYFEHKHFPYGTIKDESV